MSDEMGILCTPIAALVRTPSIKRDSRAIALKAEEIGAECIVVGLPLEMNGEHGKSALQAEEFARRLQNYTRVPVVLQDERLSSFEAEDRLREAGVKSRKVRGLLDSQSAAVILESYLGELRDTKLQERHAPEI